MKKLKLLSLIYFVSVFMCTNAYSHSAQEKNTIRIMNYNVRNGKGMDDVTNYERTAEVIRLIKPDVLALQELDSVTIRSNRVSVLDTLSQLTNMYPIYASAIDYDGGKYGIGLLSKKQPISWKKIALPGCEEKRTALIVEFDEYVFCATHLSLTDEDRILSIEIINSAIKDYNKPIFLSGDLNAHPESPEIKELQKKWTIFTNPDIFTFPADVPDETLDYICGYNNGNIYTILSSVVINEPMASDHRPIFVDVRIDNK